MSIQKKSLLSTLNTTKKAIVAATPATPEVENGTGAARNSVRLAERKSIRLAERKAVRLAERKAVRLAKR